MGGGVLIVGCRDSSWVSAVATFSNCMSNPLSLSLCLDVWKDKYIADPLHRRNRRIFLMILNDTPNEGQIEPRDYRIYDQLDTIDEPIGAQKNRRGGRLMALKNAKCTF